MIELEYLRKIKGIDDGFLLWFNWFAFSDQNMGNLYPDMISAEPKFSGNLYSKHWNQLEGSYRNEPILQKSEGDRRRSNAIIEEKGWINWLKCSPLYQFFPWIFTRFFPCMRTQENLLITCYGFQQRNIQLYNFGETYTERILSIKQKWLLIVQLPPKDNFHP